MLCARGRPRSGSVTARPDRRCTGHRGAPRVRLHRAHTLVAARHGEGPPERLDAIDPQLPRPLVAATEFAAGQAVRPHARSTERPWPACGPHARGATPAAIGRRDARSAGTRVFIGRLWSRVARRRWRRRGLWNRRSEVRILSGALSNSPEGRGIRPFANALGWQQSWQQGNSDALPLQRTRFAGVYRRGSRFVVVYRSRGPSTQAGSGDARRGQGDQARPSRVGACRAARADASCVRSRLARSLRRLGPRRGARERAPRVPPLVGDVPPELLRPRAHVRDLDRAAVQGFVDWLTSQPGRNGRLYDRSVANALTPLRAVLDAAVAEGLLEQN
jgi:hypothetical protein